MTTEVLLVQSKVCRVCGQEKDRKAFSMHLETKDGLHPYCRACLNIKTRESQERAKTNAPRTTLGAISELKLIQRLALMGIPAVRGLNAWGNRVDVVAWGCVRIEVKSSRRVIQCKNSKPGYMFRFKAWFRATDADLIILKPQDRDAYHVFRADDPIFYDENGNIKRNFWIGATEDHAAIMAASLDRWNLIEQARVAWVIRLQSSPGETLYSLCPPERKSKRLAQPYTE